VRYEVGISRFGELARAQMIGDERGMLKLLFDPDTLKLLGVHVMGESATEIIHIGQASVGDGRNDRLFPRHGLQLSDVGRGVQGGGAERDE
jgi:NAD(P) transhydrogenase